MATRGKMREEPGGDPRRGAVALLDNVLGHGQLMAEALADPPAVFAGLDPAGRARAQRLALAVLRHSEQADRLLDPHLRKAPPLTIRHILRLALVEVFELGVAPHGAVNAAVGLARANRKTAHQSGLVNAVLRKAVDAGAETWAGLPAQRMPMWLRKPLVKRWGREVVSEIERVQSRQTPVDLSCADPATAAGWAERLGAELLPTGSLRLSSPGQISALPGYDTGDWWVQDAAAALPVRMLQPQAGERILDLCAAPGGKTLQCAAAGAQVTAVDISARRLQRLHENLTRTRLAAEVVVADALHWEGSAKPFDAILLDAPCSATGTVRRHPELPFIKDGSELTGLVDLQAQLLDRAVGWLKPGGRLVFCTCSLFEEEGEAQLVQALARHPDLRVEPVLPQGADPIWQDTLGGLRLRPDFWADRGGMDGFYMARFCRA